MRDSSRGESWSAILHHFRSGRGDFFALRSFVKSNSRLLLDNHLAELIAQLAAIRDHVPGDNKVATVTEIGLTRKQVREARKTRDAERADPGITRRTLDAQLAAGEEPAKAALHMSTLNVQCQRAANPSRRHQSCASLLRVLPLLSVGVDW